MPNVLNHRSNHEFTVHIGHNFYFFWSKPDINGKNRIQINIVMVKAKGSKMRFTLFVGTAATYRPPNFRWEPEQNGCPDRINSSRYGLALVSFPDFTLVLRPIGLSTRVNPGNEANYRGEVWSRTRTIVRWPREATATAIRQLQLRFTNCDSPIAIHQLRFGNCVSATAIHQLRFRATAIRQR